MEVEMPTTAMTTSDDNSMGEGKDSSLSFPDTPMGYMGSPPPEA